MLTAWDDLRDDPLTAVHGEHLAVGVVRLDNRREVERWSGVRGAGLTDLEVVLRNVVQHGTKYLPQLIGDFGFVIWHAPTCALVAATDAFAVKKLYYATQGGLLVFASRAEALSVGDQYETRYLAEAVANCLPSPGLTVYAGVRQLEAGSLATVQQGKLTTAAYWSPDHYEAASDRTVSADAAAEECRNLLSTSVRLRLSPDDTTWAQLSGGLDSSSIVSVAQWLAERGEVTSGVIGTVTFVDRQGTDSDERTYSDAVVHHWRVRNETIVDPPFWLDDDAPPPILDQPRDSLPFHPRERRLCSIVRRAGGRVLLTGFGSDELFTGTMLFFADWIARGRLVEATRAMARRAALGRASFWELAYRNAVLPLLPNKVRHFVLRDQGRLVPWIRRSAAAQFGLRSRVGIAAAYSGEVGGKYRHSALTSVTAIGRSLDAGFIGDDLDVRYPFTYRPLVEFALRLPPDLCSRPQARKWILREAMRGILPESVRTRVGKGSASALFASSLASDAEILEPLVEQPILADLGIVDGAELAKAFHSAPHRAHRADDLHISVQATLIVEAWLQLRSGRWPRAVLLGSTRSTRQDTTLSH